MARHYSEARKNAYRAGEEKRREIKGERAQARRDKVARRDYENGGR
jgi:hypothetical protein